MSQRAAPLAACALTLAVGVVLAQLVGSACRPGQAGRGGSRGPNLHPSAADPVVFATLPDFELVRQDGAPVRRADLLGKPWVLGCFFTACQGPCPDLTRSMVAVQSALSDTDALLVSLSVDPRRDTPDVLTAYAHKVGADPERWWFLTGIEAEIYRLLIDGFRMAAGNDEAERERQGGAAAREHWYTHDVRLVAVDREGRVRGWYHHENDRDALVARMRHLAKPGS